MWAFRLRPARLFALATICLAPAAAAPAQGRPDDAARPGGAGETFELAPRFTSEAAGISFAPPAGFREIRRTGSGDQIVQYTHEGKKWSLLVSRAVLSKSVPLAEWADEHGRKQPGMLDATVDQMKADTPGVEVLRHDYVNVGRVEVGMIAARATIGLETRLTQRALVRANDRLYFSFTFISPAPRQGAVEEDADSRAAVDLFGRVVDSIRVIDQSRLIEEQNQRLFRTRALFVNLTEDKIRGTVVPEQWMRLIRDGKDIGYSYVVEEIASDLPRQGIAAAAQPRGGREGVRVGIRSRTFPDSGVQVDAETWQFVTFDRRNEIWSSVGLIANADGTKEAFSEFGSADRERRRSLDPNAAPGERLPDGTVDEKQPPIRQTEVYTLQVVRNSRAISGEEITRDLPPFYLPQALGHLLPRLAPRNEPKTYLFASWVSDQGEVMKRYVDVGSEQYVTLDGRKVRVIPVTDRVGVEGAETVHYLNPDDGRYLGSVNSESKITILATDKPTLEKIWSNPNLTRPGDVKGK